MGMRVFWDTNLFIYLVEHHPTYHDSVVELYQQLWKSGDEILTSTLTLGELLVLPLREGREDLATQYTELIAARSGIKVVTFDNRTP
jgi:predicted nucleic acid-binding protein